MNEWDNLLDGDEQQLLGILTSSSEEARRLRSSSPFAGVIPPQERWALHKAVKENA